MIQKNSFPFETLTVSADESADILQNPFNDMLAISNHDLLIAKLSAYDFSNDTLKLLYSYLNNRLHRNKINR